MVKIADKAKKLLLVIAVAALIPLSPARGTIASVTLTPAAPTPLSNGLSYYLAGITYNFEVNVIDPDITGWAQLTNVQITIPNTTNIVLQINPAGTGLNLPVTVVSGNVIAVADIPAPSTFNNCTVIFKVTIRWDTPESAFALNNIAASATTSFPVVNTSNAAVNTSYGVCSTMRIMNFVQDGVASDGLVNQYHDPFNITGTPVYNVPGVTVADAIATVDPGEITGTTLLLNGVPSGLTSPAGPGVTYGVPTATVTGFGANTWRVRAATLTAGGPEISQNSLAVNCDEVEITGISFINGGGINSPAYYRSVNIPGTEVRITARMRNSLNPMVGNTTVRIRNFTDGQNIDVLIPNGGTTGTALVPNPTVLPPDPGTAQKFYRAEQILGGAFGGDAVQGQNVSTRINQPGAVSIYWDRNDAPGADSAPFTPWGGISATAYSITFNWTALVNAAPDQDFYSYRIYYRESGAALFQQVDRNTPGFAALGNIASSTSTIDGLTPLTNYDYYITAVDVFGNEVSLANSLPGTGTFETVGTLASTITVEISDGITFFRDSTFTMPPGPDNPANRTLRQSAIRVKVFIVAAGDLPDIVNIIVADNTTGDLIDGTGVIDPVLVENDPSGFYRVTTLKTGANEWVGYIADTNPLIVSGTSVKFIIETIKDGISSYADNDSETELPPGNPNDYPYTFMIGGVPQFQPWPTRILNNVITSANPRAYPSYYLTDDAYVTISIYDIKGRIVKTIVDNSFRRGGHNIKEGGWAGDNKSKKKVGIGLYYVHVKAKRVSDGKVIINSFQKVVMAK